MIDYYDETLKKSPEALAFLGRRGVGRTDAISKFKLGFTDRTLGLRIPDKQGKEGAVFQRAPREGTYKFPSTARSPLLI